MKTLYSSYPTSHLLNAQFKYVPASEAPEQWRERMAERVREADRRRRDQELRNLQDQYDD